MTTNKARFHITIEVNVDLDYEELWPDGDGPLDPTEDDVRRLISKEGGPSRIIDEWNLQDDLDLYVHKLKEKQNVPGTP